jgi:hypothetical protein
MRAVTKEIGLAASPVCRGRHPDPSESHRSSVYRYTLDHRRLVLEKRGRETDDNLHLFNIQKKGHQQQPRSQQPVITKSNQLFYNIPSYKDYCSSDRKGWNTVS